MASLIKGCSLLTIPLVLALAGCDYESASAKGECTFKEGGGGECKVGGEIKWVRPRKPESLLPTLNAADSLPDAAQHVLDVSASTIPIPTSGTMTVRLVDSSTGKLVASQTFAWAANQGRIRPKDPNAINDWAYRNVGSADTLQYELTRFYSAYGPGPQRIAGTSTYEGVPVSSFATTFSGGPTCTSYPSPHQCSRE